MKIKINKSRLTGKIKAPPSKSYAHRLLIGTALAQGKSEISGISDSIDMKATLSCISALGIKYQKNDDSVSIIGGEYAKSFGTFNCYESGSTLRFFIPIALALKEKATFVGATRLIERGIAVYEEIFENQGITIDKKESQIDFVGTLKPGTFYMRGDVSSQFITGMLFALPLLNGDSKIVLTTALESEPYVNITMDALSEFGIEIIRYENEFFIKGNQQYAPVKLAVEGDASNSAFLDAFNLLGGDVSVLGLKNDTLQGDIVYKRYFEEIASSCPTIDLSSCPDLGPILFALAGAKNGAKFIGTKRLKIKESDRVNDLAVELEKFGIRVDAFDNEVVVHPTKITAPTEILRSHNDHRIVMALTVLSNACGGIIGGCEAVNKSYPTFFEDIKSLGALIEVLDNENN